jgi:hypothetical protein
MTSESEFNMPATEVTCYITCCIQQLQSYQTAVHFHTCSPSMHGSINTDYRKQALSKQSQRKVSRLRSETASITTISWRCLAAYQHTNNLTPCQPCKTTLRPLLTKHQFHATSYM